MRTVLWTVAVGALALGSLGVALAQDAPVVVEEDDLTSDVWHPIAYLTDAESGEPRILSAGPGYTAPVPLDGGYPVALLGPQGQSPMAWRPDGSHLAFVSNAGNGSAVVATTLAGDARVLAQGLPARAYAPQWSPSGSYLVVQAPEGAGTSVYLINALNGQSSRLSTGSIQRALWAAKTDVLAIIKSGGIEVWTPEQGQALHVPGTESVNGRASWSGDGQLLAFEGTLADGNPGIIVVRPSQGTKAEVGVGETGLRLVEMSPVREELLALRPVAPERYHVIRYGAPWKAGENLTAALGQGFVTPASVTTESLLARYSPTGEYVAFVAHPVESMLARYLYVLREGGAPICVSEPVGVQSITWSRDGAWVAFTGRRGSVGRLSQSLFVTAPTGGGYARLATNVLGYEWAPTGDALAYLAPLSRTRQLALGATATSTGEARWLALGVLRAAWCPRHR